MQIRCLKAVLVSLPDDSELKVVQTAAHTVSIVVTAPDGGLEVIIGLVDFDSSSGGVVNGNQ